MIWAAYCGYCWVVSSAPTKDFVSWFWTLSLTCAELGAEAIAAEMAEA